MLDASRPIVQRVANAPRFTGEPTRPFGVVVGDDDRGRLERPDHDLAQRAFDLLIGAWAGHGRSLPEAAARDRQAMVYTAAMRRWFPVAALAVAIVVVIAAPRLARPGVEPAGAAPVPRASPTSSARWVAVSVATLWVEPDTARDVDAPALANPADPRKWVAGMTVAQKRWLVGRLETQALYGDQGHPAEDRRRLVEGRRRRPADAARQPGLPRLAADGQLTETPPALRRWPRGAHGDRAAADRLAARDGRAEGRVLELSYGTRLPAVSWTDTAVEVVTLDGTHLFLRRSVVALRETGTPWPTLKGAKLVDQAKRFLGLQYLWAGTSGFGFDCSGFTHLVYKALGTTIPRDAGPQSAQRHEDRTARASLRRGDLVFFRNASGVIHHVGMYVGDGRFIHAPADRQGGADHVALGRALPERVRRGAALHAGSASGSRRRGAALRRTQYAKIEVFVPLCVVPIAQAGRGRGRAGAAGGSCSRAGSSRSRRCSRGARRAGRCRCRARRRRGSGARCSRC